MDREAGDQYREVFPEIVDIARASRQFLTRAVSYLAGEAQVRQFLDIGTGLPTADKTHADRADAYGESWATSATTTRRGRS